MDDDLSLSLSLCSGSSGVVDFGKRPRIMSFVGNHIGVRRADGSLVSSSVSPYPSALHGYVSAHRWDDAVRLCRYIKVSMMMTDACYSTSER